MIKTFYDKLSKYAFDVCRNNDYWMTYKIRIGTQVNNGYRKYSIYHDYMVFEDLMHKCGRITDDYINYKFNRVVIEENPSVIEFSYIDKDDELTKDMVSVSNALVIFPAQTFIF